VLLWEEPTRGAREEAQLGQAGALEKPAQPGRTMPAQPGDRGRWPTWGAVACPGDGPPGAQRPGREAAHPGLLYLGPSGVAVVLRRPMRPYAGLG
jgi:hypothetical protein